MPGDVITITLTAKDGASQTFKTVGRSAQDMGKQVEDSAKRADSMGDRFSSAGARIGVAFTAVSGALSDFSRLNAESEASQARLETAIENTGHTTLEYADALDAASKSALQLGFDDEDAADAIAAMTNATGDAQQAINDLSIAEDIARARNISLEAATKLVIAAEQGRLGALQRVGIQLDASATKEQAVDALRAKFAGNADAYATTTAGAYDRIANKLENVEEALGAHLGALQPILALLPGLSAGYTLAGAAVGAFTAAEGEATIASLALDVALGPIGLVAAALVAGGALALFISQTNDAGDQMLDTAASADTLAQHLADLAQQGFTTAQLETIRGYEEAIQDMGRRSNDAVPHLNAVNDAITQIQAQLSGPYPLTINPADEEKARAALESQLSTLEDVRDRYNSVILTNEQYLKVQQDIQDIYSGANPLNFALVEQHLADLTADMKAGGETADQYVQNVADLKAQEDTYGLSLDQITQQTLDADAASSTYFNTLGRGGKSLQVLGDQFLNMSEAGDAAAKALHATFVNSVDGAGKSVAVLGDQFTTLDGQVDDTAAAHASMASAIERGNEMFAAEAVAAQAAAAALGEQIKAVGQLDTFLTQLIAVTGGTWAERSAARIVASTDALQSATSVVIDNTDAIAQSSSQLNDWAIDLINVQGTYGKIDDLLAAGTITLDQYNDAQQAQIEITDANNRVQQDVLTIQAQQAPLLGKLAQQHAKYMDQLTQMPAQQQMVALGWMDQNEAMKAQAALALAAAAAQGQYGDAGEQAAQTAIAAQAEADPYFQAMLDDMGLISVGADGTITVNFPDSETIQEAVDGLTGSIDALTAALGGIPPSVNTNVTVGGVDAASGAVSNFRAQLDSINGKTVYTYVYNVQYGPSIGLTPGDALGGMIPSGTEVRHAQHGAALSGWSWVGEAGPELIYAPGSRVMPHTASVAMTNAQRPSGGMVLNRPTINVYANNPREFSDAMTSYRYADMR